MHESKKSYRGRFAPSPTGPLHFGSLVAAVGSYLDARKRGGKWSVRMEDLDPPREAPGAAGAILRTLEAYGFEWDGKVVFQSRRGAAYDAALARLEREKAVFRCACTRREISDSALSLAGEPIYPGTCRGGLPPGRAARAVRVRVDNGVTAFDDALQGRIEQNLAREVGDFVVRRADGLFAYQLAVVVDDFEQGITDVVRGADLLASTPRQVLLQRLLGYPRPRYMHLPVAVNRNGEKLSKQTLAAPLTIEDAPAQLVRALRFLGQEPPADLAATDLTEIWSWALPSWRTNTIPRQRSFPEPEAR
ncbi:MAG: tRNA glutamyl-Q(34) synthetase GluQRS [Betaproteobacteria bacterium]|nr:MAG: tRNA glutamyl-Q(34) synthetase GluQRS [Betaproteobacteria bacterium]